jgi:hypothetical protein
MVRAVLAAAAAALVVPVSARAALSFAFDHGKARVGQRVHAYQADPYGNPVPVWDKLDGVTLYLARADNLSRRVRLGQMQVDSNGVWSIDFRVPKVKPGLFMIAFSCRPCGDTYFGSTELGARWTGKAGRVLKVRR